MSRSKSSLRDRLIEARSQLRISQAELARQLRITPEWMSRLINGHVEGSDDLSLRLDVLLGGTRGGRSAAVREDRDFDAPLTQPGGYEDVVAMRRRPADGVPSTRADVEGYFKHYLDRAAGSGNPNAFPAIQHRLEKHFPLDEWDEYAPPKLEEP